MPRDQGIEPRLTGVTRMLLDAAVETQLRSALHAAGYRDVTRRAGSAALVFDARP